MTRTLLAALALTAAAALGACAKCPTQPVCHAPTEDSIPTDCEYHRDDNGTGGWYQT